MSNVRLEVRRSRFDRLTAADAANLATERPEAPWHLGLIGVLEGGPLTAPDGGPKLGPVRDALAGAVERVPRLRQVVHRTYPGQGAPIWVDVDVDLGSVDLDGHLKVVPIAASGSETTYLRACASVLEPRLDRSRPLWDLTLLPGWSQDRVGLVLRLHHAVADGVAASRIIEQIFDVAATDTAPDRPTSSASSSRSRTRQQDERSGTGGSRRREATRPSGMELAGDAWRVRLSRARALLAGDGVERIGAAGRAAAAQLGALASAREPVSATSFNGRLSPDRRVAFGRVALAPLRAVAREHGGTVNDALLAAVTGGARAVLAARGEDRNATLRVSVPVSLRSRDDDAGSSLGNQVGVLLVPLPMDEPDPRRALERIVASTHEQKQRARVAGRLPPMTGAFAVRLALPWLRHQRLVSLFVTNVPGPSKPLSLAGARLLEAYPYAPIAGNVTLGVGALSYAGDLGLSLVADAESWSDLGIFLDGLLDTAEKLTGSRVT